MVVAAQVGVQVLLLWMLYFFTGMALRESVLKVNGSAIRPWCAILWPVTCQAQGWHYAIQASCTLTVVVRTQVDTPPLLGHRHVHAAADAAGGLASCPVLRQQVFVVGLVAVHRHDPPE